MWRRILRTRLAKVVIVIVVLTVAWRGYLMLRAPSVVSAELSAEVDQGEPVEVAVHMGFPPERFHTLFLQDYGNVVSVTGDMVVLRDVRPESVGMLAQVYWIDLVETREEAS